MSIREVRPSQSHCRFAIATADITPPTSIYHRMWGAAKHDRATGVHRPLRASVVVFAPPNESAEKQIILALDHCTLGIIEHDQLVTRVAEASGESKESILVVFSHTHGAGLMGLDRVSLPGGDLIPPYLEFIARTSAELLTRCTASLQPVNIVYGRGRCGLATNRDYFDAEAEQYVVGFNPGAPADDTLIVGRVTDNDGRAVAVIVNYACHPTTLAWDNTLISPDYIGAMREVIEGQSGATCLFLQGACGELGPKEGFVGDVRVADRNGRELGFAALSVLTALPEPNTSFCYSGPVVSGATLGAWRRVPCGADAGWQLVRWHEPLRYRAGLPTVEQTKKELQQFLSEEADARARDEHARAADCRAMAERKHRMLYRLEPMPKGECYPLQVVVMRLGNAVWVGVQGESYSLLQTELRQRFPDRTIVVASLAGDWGASYLPPRELYDKGMYQESIAVVAPGSLEQLTDRIAERIRIFS